MTTRVLNCDDQEPARAGLRMIVDSRDDLTVAGAAAVEQAIALRPDVVLMDVLVPVLDGVEATGKICARLPGTRVLIITTFDLDEYAHHGLRAGAVGYVVKDAPAAELLVAIRGVLRGDAMVAPSVTRRLLDRFLAGPPDTRPLDVLTERERDVLALVGQR